MKPRRLSVAFVGVCTPGYRSLALDYLEATAAADPRLDLATWRLDVHLDSDPWWIAYRILGMDPAPDVIAMPALCWTARSVYEVARIVKAARPAMFIVLGGPEVSPISEEVLTAHPQVDAVVRGEGEFAFRDLLHSLARGGDPGSVPGVSARDGGGIVTGPARDPIADLDDVPSPYRRRPLATDGSAYLETYRGCPHGCAYCFEGKGSTRIRSFSWERIAEDIAVFAATPGMRSFSFIDPVFNLTPERLGRLSDLLAPHAARGVRLHTIEVDIERIDDEAARLLARAGVASVETGPQTVGQAALAACARSLDRDRFAAGVDSCKRAGIAVECDLIIGLPGDTEDDVMAGIEFVTDLDPGVLQLSTLHVLPGTRLWDEGADLGLVFDREPPHELIRSRDLDFGDLRRIEVFGRSLSRLHRAGSARPAPALHPTPGLMPPPSPRS